jgi:hypothetical protein
MQTDIFKISMRNGLFMGILFSVNFIFSASRNMVLMLLTYLVVAIIIGYTYKSAISFRDNILGGYISYWKTVYFTILSFFFAGILSALFKIIYTTNINPEYLTLLFEEGVRQAEQNRAILERLNITMDEAYFNQLERQFRPVSYAFQTIWVNLMSGAFLGLIIGGIVRRKPGLFDDKQPTQEDNATIH